MILGVSLNATLQSNWAWFMQKKLSQIFGAPSSVRLATHQRTVFTWLGYLPVRRNTMRVISISSPRHAAFCKAMIILLYNTYIIIINWQDESYLFTSTCSSLLFHWQSYAARSTDAELHCHNLGHIWEKVGGGGFRVGVQHKYWQFLHQAPRSASTSHNGMALTANSLIKPLSFGWILNRISEDFILLLLCLHFISSLKINYLKKHLLWERFFVKKRSAYNFGQKVGQDFWSRVDL